MKIPKYVQDKIYQRAKAAERFMSLDKDISDWLEKKGFDLSSPPMSDHTRLGAPSLCEPWMSAHFLNKVIERCDEPYEKD